MFLNINNLDDFFEKVGIVVTTFLFLHFFSTLILRLLTFPFRRTYIKKYGANSWALVTGASDGIGKAFCQELAQEGFNILLIARNKEKLEKVCQELKEINPNVQTKIIIMDFKKAHLPGAFDHCLPELKSLDISILVNNVGMGLLGHFEELSEEQILEIMGLNIYPLTRLSKILLPQLEKRAHRSAIINVGSMAGIRPCPYFSVYSASKVYTDFFTKALSVEYPKVDMICVSPFYVSTPATLNRKVSFDTITANDCARSTMNDLGFTTHTYGHWKHDIFGKGAILMPQWFLDFFAKTSALMEIKRRERVSKSE